MLLAEHVQPVLLREREHEVDAEAVPGERAYLLSEDVGPRPRGSERAETAGGADGRGKLDGRRRADRSLHDLEPEATPARRTAAAHTR